MRRQDSLLTDSRVGAYPQFQCLHELFETQVELTPDSTALIFEGQSLTYRELNERANQLAHYLRRLGVEPETLVAICLERSVEMVVGLFGILKAGAAYVPVDPAYPSERLNYMLQDSGSPVILTQHHLLKSLPRSEATVLALDTDWKTIQTQPPHNPSIQLTPNSLSYVIYTSGSTGKPKGAMNTHAGIFNRLRWMQDTYKLDPTDRVLQKTPFSFDVSVWEFFWTLSTGACMVIARPQGHHDNAYLVNLIAETGITTLHFVPSMLQVFLEEPNLRTRCSSLRRVICSGEALSYDLQNRFFRQLDAELHNLYGPTEAAVDVTFWQCDPESELRVVPIGRAIDNVQIHLLDHELKPVGPGEPGELHIGGICLARGYLNRADLTAASFIPHPLATNPGDRLYKTGDLARYLPDGAIEYLGRIDQQLKICGVRIEVGEIESAMVEHPAVRETVVIAREDRPGDKRVVAYLVAENTDDANIPSQTELRSFLEERLPHYMVPSAFVWMAKLPLSPNGKVDRRQLPAPANVSREIEELTPRTPIEELVAGTWCEVMGLTSVGVDDNFFQLGGHSLLAGLLASRLRRALQTDLSVPDIFESPTVAQIAAKLESRLQSGQRKPTYSVKQKREGKRIFKLSDTQQRLWFLHRLKPDSAFYNLPLVARLRGRLNLSALEESLNEIGRRHELLRTKFLEVDGMPMQVIEEPSRQKLEVLNAGGATESQREEEALRIVNELVRRPFELTRHYLWRFLVVHVSDQEHLLVIVMHHIVSDGWSLNVLAEELSTLYTAFAQGHSSPLKELSVQWADYAEWQRELLSPEVEQKQLQYWKTQLAGSAPVLQLPSDRSRPSVTSYEGNTYHITLPASLAEALRSLSRRASSTLYMTLLAAFNVLVYRYTGQSDIITGTPLAGRNSPESEKLIGFFVNTIAIRIRLSSDQRFRELLDQTRETTLAAYSHQDVQFDRLVEELHIERSLSYAPIFQIVFALNNTPAPRLELVELESRLLEIDTKTSKFDLSFFVDDTGAELKIAVEYSTALFDVATIERLTRHFQTLVESIVADPEQTLSNLKLLADSETEQLISQGAGARRDFPQDTCIHQLFEQQVERTPDALAVVDDNYQLTYAELNRKANQLAHHLRSLEVGPETIVGLCMTRSPNMIVSALGVLKAGGAYAPLDPAYPKERIAFMLEETAAPVLLTERAVLERVPSSRTHIICLEDKEEMLASHRDTNPACSAQPDNLAYIIFTSGSTGKPKGVALQHKGLVSLTCWHHENFQTDERSRVSQVAGPSFDAAVWDLWSNLTSGATLYLAGDETALSSTKLWQWLNEKSITHCFLPTPLLESVLPVCEASLNDGFSTTLRYLFTGGDKLHQRPSRDLPFALVNLYGPSEVTVISTSAVIESRAHADSPPDIGRPINNTHVFILDMQLQPVPIGVVGELYVSGIGQARGYLNQPEMTAERFLPNPYSSEGGERMYATGDLARYLPDGSIECLGRVDDQIKIRGFRIELGEIETALGQHECVREAVVVVRPDGRGGNQLVAYTVASSEHVPTAAELRSYLKNTLPEYMIPTILVSLDALPLTPNGKVDRQRLPAIDEAQPQLEERYVSPRSELERAIASIWQQVLQLNKVGIHDNFFNLGGHSLLLVQVNNKLREILHVDVSIIDMFQYPTISSLAEHLDQAVSTQTRIESRVSASQPAENDAMDVAIIGMSGRFPGARNLSEFWQNLKNERESITFFTAEELKREGVNGILGDPNYVLAKAVLEDVELFDAAFFDYNPREAEMLDPQHRVLLESAVEALEHAGYDPDRYAGRIGVYAGVSAGSYLTSNLNSHADLIERVGAYQVEIGNRSDFVPTAISFKLNLKGPSVNIQTACSTSLVAVHQACQSLLNGDCDLALAGGGSITFPHKIGYLYQKEGIMSPDGHCRAFDENGRGTVAGEGAGLVVLKRLVDALADGDTIHAIIKGSAINNDGSLKVGFTAPSVDGQATVIAEAMRVARVETESISYVEAHGTGTILGDPIEIAALTQAYRSATQKRGFCAIGSLKTNIGHLDAAAGIAGLIKTTLALKHKQIPASLHYQRPNARINFEQSPFFVNTKLMEWKNGTWPRRAGVSSFGIGGTNAHIIVQEAPSVSISREESAGELLILSAKTSSALEIATQQFVRSLKEDPDVSLADVAFTLQVGRRQFAHRRMLVCRDTNDAVTELSATNSKRVLSSFREAGHRPCVFMFPGQGTQYAGMSQELYEAEPLFREEIDRCAELLIPHLNLDPRELIYPTGERREEASTLLAQTFITQPAIFIVEYALARLLMSWGVEPSAMIGHSVGEYVAACLAGVFSLEDALALIAARGRLIQQLPAGQMLAVQLAEDEMKDLLRPGLSLAVVNAPKSCVVAGSAELVRDLQNVLKRNEIHSQLLQTSHAFHSEMLEPVVDEFTRLVGQVTLHAPSIPFISNVTGDWIATADATDPHYWARHMRQTVRFSEGIRELLSRTERILIEVGPGHTLSRLAKQHPHESDKQAILTSLPDSEKRHSDADALLTTLGRFWLAGGTVDWTRFNSGKQRRRVPLPTYPFERKRYYVEPNTPSLKTGNNGGKSQTRQIGNRLYLPSWKRVALGGVKENRSQQEGVLLVFLDQCGLGAELAGRLTEAGGQVVTVRAGDRFGRTGENDYTIDPKKSEDYQSLVAALVGRGVTLKRVAHLWSVTGNEEDAEADGAFERAQELGLYSLIFLTQALAKNLTSASLEVVVVTNNVQEVVGDEVLRPEKATVMSVCKVMPREHSGIFSRNVDVGPIPTRHRERLLAQLFRELTNGGSDRVAAYRGRHCWVQTFEPVAEQFAGEQRQSRLREGGVYLITDGLSRTGLSVARFLAGTVHARLALITRDDLTDIVEPVQELESMGAEVWVHRATLSDEGGMREALLSIEKRFGGLHGVIHAGTKDGPGKKIVEMTPSDCEHHFQSTARELTLLEAVLSDYKLDFCLVFSEDMFADVMVQQHNHQHAATWTSINWDTTTALSDREQEFSELLGRVLSLPPTSQVIISSTDLESGLEAVYRPSAMVQETVAQPEPEIQVENEKQKILVNIWQDLLGVKHVGLDDSFFDLDGHSLLGTMMLSRIRKSLGVELEMTDIFKAPTIRKLSLIIEEQGQKKLTASPETPLGKAVRAPRPKIST